MSSVRGCNTSRNLPPNKTKICQEGARKQINQKAFGKSNYNLGRKEVEKRNALPYKSNTEIVKIAEN